MKIGFPFQQLVEDNMAFLLPIFYALFFSIDN